MLPAASVVLVLVSNLFLFVLAKLTIGAGDIHQESLFFFHPLINWTVIVLALLGELGLLFYAIRFFRHRRYIFGILFLGGLLVSLAVFVLFNLLIWFSVYKPGQTVVTEQGKYCVLTNGDFFGTNFILASPESSDFLGIYYTKLGVSQNTQDGYVLIRPTLLANTKAYTPFVTANGMVCVMGSLDFVVYDPATKKSYTNAKRPSPYILMDNTSPIHQADEDLLIRRYSQLFSKADFFVEALNHPNPNVQESAKRVLGALNVPIPASQPVGH